MPVTGNNKSVLFVCFGNTCRSTMSEAIFHHLLQQRGLQDQWNIDSAGTSNINVGKPPDPRTMNVLQKHGITQYKHLGHRSRQITEEDFTKFDYIFAMDDKNMRNIKDTQPKTSTAAIELLGRYDPHNVLIIDDPYIAYEHNKNAYDEVYDICIRCCQAFLDHVESR